MSSAPEPVPPIDAQIRSLEQANPLREPTMRSVIAALKLPPGSQGLDVGCGIGRQALLLAEATGPHGRVTGLDISAGLVAYAQDQVKTSAWVDRITFTAGDMNQMPFPDDTFDWVWSADCAGYPAGDLLPTLKEMARVVRPGGTLAILAWTSQQVLPGHAMLEARLNATCSAYAPLLRGQSPESHFLRALRSFSAARLTQATAHTFIGEVQAPLSTPCRTALVSLFEMLWGEAHSLPAESDRAEYARLCREKSPEFILNLPEYYAFFTYTLFSGRVTK